MLLRQIDASLGLSRTLAGCFEDRRDQRFVDHSMVQLLAQRIYAVGLGYEDLNDLTELRRDRGIALASPSTLNRLELSNHKASSAHKLPHDPAKVQACLLRMGVRCLPKHAKEIVLDLDSVRHLLQGLREGRHYNDYYGDCCNVPLFIVAGDVVLWAQLRTSDMDGADGVMSALEKIMAAIRRRCKKSRIIVRGESGFCRDAIMTCCEGQPDVYYSLGWVKTRCCSKTWRRRRPPRECAPVSAARPACGSLPSSRIAR